MTEIQENPNRRLHNAPRLKSKITKDQIYDAIERHSGHCMIAEAIKASDPNLTYISVDLQTIRATDRSKNERYVWLTPRKLQQMLVDFDGGLKDRIVPTDFELRNGQTISSGLARKKKLQSTANSKSHTSPRKRKNKTLTPPLDAGATSFSVPDVIGGAAPPIPKDCPVRYPGNRRTFGLRALRI